jgi:hypothetical protein
VVLLCLEVASAVSFPLFALFTTAKIIFNYN